MKTVLPLRGDTNQYMEPIIRLYEKDYIRSLVDFMSDGSGAESLP